MDNRRLAEIKKRTEALREGRLAGRSALLASNRIIAEDVPALLAEVERLRETIERIRTFDAGGPRSTVRGIRMICAEVDADA